MSARCGNVSTVPTDGGVLGDGGIRALAAFPRLVSLDLNDVTYRGNNQEHVIAELVEHGTTALRELRVFENLTAPAMTSWLTAMPQLELLDLRPARELHDQSPVIEGDVVTLPGRRSSTLLTVDDNAPEPWWDRIDVLTL